EFPRHIPCEADYRCLQDREIAGLLEQREGLSGGGGCTELISRVAEAEKKQRKSSDDLERLSRRARALDRYLRYKRLREAKLRGIELLKAHEVLVYEYAATESTMVKSFELS